MTKRFFLTAILAASLIATYAQPFADEIRHFKKEDSLHFPPPGEILFVGSSSFRIWTTMQDDFPGYPLINRGFGGATYPDLLRYINETVFPYHPKQIVIYCGDNDLVSSSSITADSVISRFKVYFNTVRAKLPDVAILFVSIKPSPSRASLMPAMERANTVIKDFLGTQTNTAFADVYHPMLGTDGKPMEDIFKEDKLHMNSRGYAIWIRIIQPYLLK